MLALHLVNPIISSTHKQQDLWVPSQPKGEGESTFYLVEVTISKPHA
jgi:hypothetical protein